MSYLCAAPLTHTRCAAPWCRTTICLDQDPAALCDTCHQVRCWADQPCCDDQEAAA